jgi:integrase
MLKIKFTEQAIAKLKRKPTRYLVGNKNLSGHYIRVYPSGKKMHYALTRGVGSPPPLVWKPLGDATLLGMEEAEEKARTTLKAVRKGESSAGPRSFQAVAEEWFQQRVIGMKLRSHAHIRLYLNKHLLPAWPGREFTTIRRGDVNLLLNAVAAKSGPVAADKVLALMSSICGWYVTQTEDYSSPIVKGMRHSSPKDRARERTFNDDELRAIWQAATENGSFGAFVRLLLLTGQRRDKVATMRWEDVSNGVWLIPSEKREKGNAGELVLPQIALDIINAQPRFANNPYVFASRGRTQLQNHTVAKAAFEAKLPPMPQWQLHDCRRTARSLMARAGVRPDIAERVLGHKMKGVEATYDRHHYLELKAHALKALAGLIENIVNPPAKNVVSLVANRGELA